MRIKMGASVPKMGTTVHLDADQAAYRKAIADTLRRELGPTHQAIKTVMRWTGASERKANALAVWRTRAERRVSDPARAAFRCRVDHHPDHGRATVGAAAAAQMCRLSCA